MNEIVIVAAIGENGVIGFEGGLPWHLRSDLAHFRALTINKPVVMGRKTFESIGRPLKDRTNIVITRDLGLIAPGTVLASSRCTQVVLPADGRAGRYEQPAPDGAPPSDARG